MAGPLIRYALAIAGPIGSAGAQFLLSLALLRVMTPDAFGRFSFLLIASQLSWGIWTALFCAPLPILVASYQGEARVRLVRCLMLANLLGSAAAFCVFVAIGLALGAGTTASLLFAGYAAVALLRWFARAHAYAGGRPLQTTASDLVYAVLVLSAPLLVLRAPAHGLAIASGTLLAGAAAGLLPFGPSFLREQFLHVGRGTLASYPAVWRAHSGWSLLGVVTTEATANAHAYLVTLLRGPAAFAPIAASALLLRPITVAMNALTEFERAQMARQLGADDLARAQRSVRFFRAVLTAAWLGTVAAAFLLLHFAPHLLFPPQYQLRFLVIGTVLWMLVGAVRAGRTPESALLQAGGAFRPLAMASVWSCGLSVVAVLILLVTAGPLWSIAGILLGEGAFGAMVWWQAARWMAARQGARTVQAEGRR